MTDSRHPLGADYDLAGVEDRWARWNFKKLALAAAISALISAGSAIWVVNDVKTSVKGQVQRATLRASQHNCQTQQQGRIIGDEFKFGMREELRILPDAIAAGPKSGKRAVRTKKFLAAELAKVNTDLAIERMRITDQIAVKNHVSPLPRRIDSLQALTPLLADSRLLPGCSYELLSR